MLLLLAASRLHVKQHGRIVLVNSHLMVLFLLWIQVLRGTRVHL